VPRALILAAALLGAGCNEIRYQTGRLRRKASEVEAPKLASLPDRRFTYDCKNGDPFEVYFPPGGAGVVLAMGGDDHPLREVESAVGSRRFSDGSYELYLKDESAYVTLDDKRIRDGCAPRP
jgi:membrane-bound inhibitor of C-type lysozyme